MNEHVGMMHSSGLVELMVLAWGCFLVCSAIEGLLGMADNGHRTSAIYIRLIIESLVLFLMNEQVGMGHSSVLVELSFLAWGCFLICSAIEGLLGVARGAVGLCERFAL